MQWWVSETIEPPRWIPSCPLFYFNFVLDSEIRPRVEPPISCGRRCCARFLRVCLTSQTHSMFFIVRSVLIILPFLSHGHCLPGDRSLGNVCIVPASHQGIHTHEGAPISLSSCLCPLVLRSLQIKPIKNRIQNPVSQYIYSSSV